AFLASVSTSRPACFMSSIPDSSWFGVAPDVLRGSGLARCADAMCAAIRLADGLRGPGAETPFPVHPSGCSIATGGDEPRRLRRRATDPEFLSRVQFALTASFHFLYPPLSMGLGLMLIVIGVAYARTKDPKWRQLSFFWVKIYGLIFAMGVATGIVQEFEFGMNWADYSRFVGNVFGSLLAAEGVFAFALEGGFLGLLLFGGNRLGPRLWLFATAVVVFGAHF